MLDNNTIDLFMDAMPDGILICDGDGTILKVNSKVQNLLGFHAEDLAGEKIEYLLPQGARMPHKVLREIFLKSPQSRTMGDSRNIMARKKDNSELPVTVSLSPFSTEGQNVTIVCIRDDQARQEHRLREKVIEAQRQQAQKYESLGIMSSGIAHDLNNLLFVVMGNVDLALQGTSEEGGLATKLINIRNVTEQIADLTQRIMTFSGKFIEDEEEVNISLLCEEMGKLLGVSIPQHISVLFQSISSQSLSIMGDACQLRQLVSNLIINASEAIGEKEGVIEVRTGREIIDLDDRVYDTVGKLIPAGNYNFIEVKDPGSGMSEVTRKKLFDPYFTTKFTGRGLGLSVVYGVVQAHDALITVESEEDKGTVFKVYFAIRQTEFHEPVLVHLKNCING